MTDRTAMVVTVLCSHAGTAALVLTVTTLLIGSVNARLDDLVGTVNGRFDDLGGRFDDLGGRFDDDLGGRFDDLGGRFDDLGGRFDDLNDRMIAIENGLHELRSLLLERLEAEPPAL